MGIGVVRGGLTGLASLWVALLVLTPLWLDRPAAPRPFVVVSALTWTMAARICHQRPERSWHPAGRQMPVCGRCVGLYVAGAAGLLAAALARRRTLTSLRGRRALVLAALPILLTWCVEMAGLWDPGTALRTLSALPFGLAAGWLIGTAR